MGLSRVFKSLKTAEKFYLTILISDSSIQASLWKVGGDGLEILTSSTPKSYQDLDEAVVKVDQSLQELGKQSEGVNDVVFGLLPIWVNDQGVAADKKPLLKKITEELALKAVGFVVTSEALSRQLAVENTRLSALLIEFSQHELYLSLLDKGKLVSTKYVGRSDQVIADMTEALARLNAHLEEEIKFPAKMMMSSLDLDDDELKEQQQVLLNHDWVNSHPFSQPPTVDILDRELILEAVIKQGGNSVTKNNDLKVVTPPQEKLPVKEATLLAVEEKTAPPSQVTSFGVPVKIDQLPNINNITKSQLKSNSLEQKVTQSPKKHKKQMRIFSWFAHHRSFAMGGFIAGLITLGILGLVWLKAAVRVEVVLDFVTQAVAKEAQITLDPDIASSDIEKLILAASVLEKSVSGSKATDTTGVKLVGEEATGKVMIYNKTTSEKTFDQGSKISKGNLVFTLNESVKIASASVEKSVSGGTETVSKEYGKAEVEVTAADIGADYNLSVDTQLQVASFDPDTYSATVTQAFSGGSSREVRVVSAGDRSQLLSALRQELVDRANKEMKAQLEENNYLIPTGGTKQEKTEFSSEIADEVNTLSLDLNLIVESLVYHTDDLRPLAYEILKDDIPEGYTLEENEPQILSAADEAATQSGTVTLTMNINSQVKPNVDLNELKNEILGKDISEVKQALVARDEFEAVEIKVYPSFAAKLWSRLPSDAAKIEIK